MKKVIKQEDIPNLFRNLKIYEMLKQVQHDKILAFTLAEVLITLTIIGVIAAITIPNLMQKYKNRVTVTKVQKAYNILSRAATNIKVNTGCDNVDCLSWPRGWDGEPEAQGVFSEYAQLKEAEVYKGSFYPQYLSCESEQCGHSSPRGYIITQDGFLYHITFDSNSDGKIIVVYVGIDYKFYGGTKANPNDKTKNQFTFGRNYFSFIIYGEFKVAPMVYGFGSKPYPLKNMAYNSVVNLCNPSLSANGSTPQGSQCAARILLDGWKMNY